MKIKNDKALEIARAAVLKFPDASSRSLGRKLFTENPRVFGTENKARDMVRYLRGKRGVGSRVYNGALIDKLAKLKRPKAPPGKKYMDNWEPIKIGARTRTLVLSDLHAPFHDHNAVTKAVSYGVNSKCDQVLLLGDFIDCYALSFWEKDPRQRDFQAELEISRKLIEFIRASFPKARIIYKEGNHEERFSRYMMVRAPELLGVNDFEIPALLRLSDYGVEYVTNRKILHFGKLNAVHGHEFGKTVSAPVNPARTFFLRGRECCIGGHLHRTSEHTEVTMKDKIISTWSVGCLCDLHPEYLPLNSWNLGFAVIHLYDDEQFEVENLRIVNGKIY